MAAAPQGAAMAEKDAANPKAPTNLDHLTDQEKQQTWTEWAKEFTPPMNFDKMTIEEKRKAYMEWAKEKYHEQYESWMPWIEDHFLKWFTDDNKASYAAKDNLSKTKVTGNEQVDSTQDSVNNAAAGQLGQGGSLQGVGDAVSQEGVNRAERQGKDDKGGHLPTNL